MNRAGNHREDRFGIETLEGRAVMAGNIAAAVVNGNLVLTGDDYGNSVTVEQVSNGKYKLMGISGQAGPTTVNGQNSVVVQGVSGDVKVQLNGGYDYIAFNPNASGSLKIARDLNITMGAGNDRVVLNNVKTGRDLRIDAGGDADSITVAGTQVGRDLFLQFGSGNDEVTFDKGKVQRDAVVLGDQGDDYASLTQSTFQRDTLIDLGADRGIFNVFGDKMQRDLRVANAGKSIISVTDGSVGRDVLIQGGSVDDYFNVYGMNIQRDLSIQSGDGKDSFNVSNLKVNRKITVDSGAGADQVNLYLLHADEIFVELGSGDDRLDAGKLDGKRATFRGTEGMDKFVKTGDLNFKKSLVIESFEL